MTKQSLMAAGLFVLGCATGGVASHMVEPAGAQVARQPVPQRAWQYLCISDSSAESIQFKANNLGRQGWELAVGVLSGSTSFSNPILCFKR